MRMEMHVDSVVIRVGENKAPRLKAGIMTGQPWRHHDHTGQRQPSGAHQILSSRNPHTSAGEGRGLELAVSSPVRRARARPTFSS